MVEIDGSTGEGGGQIVRTSLSLSLVTGRPLRLTNIRARRDRPGLLRQHLTAVQAAARIGAAEVDGATPGSRALSFHPRALLAGHYHHAIGTAGSTTLVAQTVLPALLVADGESHVTIEGGTHNPMSPSFDFLQRAFAPQLARMGGELRVELERAGFFPAGGGRIRFDVRPGRLRGIELLDRGAVRGITAICLVAGLPEGIAEREAEVLRQKLDLRRDDVRVVTLPEGPGNVCTVDVHTDAGVQVFTGFGQPRIPAEKVAAGVVREVKAFLRAERAAVEPHLADQLLLPLALAGGGAFRTLRPSSHAETNARVIEAFLDVSIAMRQDGTTWVIEVEPRPKAA
ncbi:MAG: RNA 3'-terminal phosphate cyclase [Planctomycetes bacterium]|nr:RNA 3'-terminal phosphate cyclase [Planctomycetota bacterium]